MHASHEQVAPPPDDPTSVRRARRRKIVAMALALFTMVPATFAIATSARPPEANAQVLPVIAELTGECVADMSVFHVSMTNTRATTFNFQLELSANGAGGGNQFTDASVAAGGAFTFDFMPETPSAAQWAAYFFDADANYLPTGQSNLLDDPCSDTTTTDETTTDETTTDETTTDETTTDETTTDESTTEETTTEESTVTSTDDLGFPTVTTTTDIAPVASTTSGGGLAQTGVAVVVLLGGAAVLLFNGIGLTRITRRGWGLKDED